VVENGTTVQTPRPCVDFADSTTTGLRLTISGGRKPPASKSHSRTSPRRGW